MQVGIASSNPNAPQEAKELEQRIRLEDAQAGAEVRTPQPSTLNPSLQATPYTLNPH